MGFWNSLTIQGKLAIAAGILGGLFLLSLAYGEGNNKPNDNGPGFSTTTIQGQAFATNTPGFRVEVPTAAGSPTAVPPTLPPVPTSTVAAATTPAAAVATRVPTQIPTPLPPEDTPVPPPPPTSTPAGGCRVQASVAGNTVTGTLTCGGSPVGAGAPMTATFSFENLSSGCSGIGNASGTATCTAQPSTPPGALLSVHVCMTGTAGRVCTTV